MIIFGALITWRDPFIEIGKMYCVCCAANGIKPTRHKIIIINALYPSDWFAYFLLSFLLDLLNVHARIPKLRVYNLFLQYKFRLWVSHEENPHSFSKTIPPDLIIFFISASIHFDFPNYIHVLLVDTNGVWKKFAMCRYKQTSSRRNPSTNKWHTFLSFTTALLQKNATEKEWKQQQQKWIRQQQTQQHQYITDQIILWVWVARIKKKENGEPYSHPQPFESRAPWWIIFASPCVLCIRIGNRSSI